MEKGGLPVVNQVINKLLAGENVEGAFGYEDANITTVLAQEVAKHIPLRFRYLT